MFKVWIILNKSIIYSNPKLNDQYDNSTVGSFCWLAISETSFLLSATCIAKCLYLPPVIFQGISCFFSIVGTTLLLKTILFKALKSASSRSIAQNLATSMYTFWFF